MAEETVYATVVTYDAIVKGKNRDTPIKRRTVIIERRMTSNIHETPIMLTSQYNVPFDGAYQAWISLNLLSKLFISTQAMNFLSGSSLNLYPEIESSASMNNKLFWLEDSNIENIPILHLMQKILEDSGNWVDQLYLKSALAGQNDYLENKPEYPLTQLFLDYGFSPDSALILFEPVDASKSLIDVNLSVDVFLATMKRKYTKRTQADGSVKYVKSRLLSNDSVR
jgi:hypothetical protein